MLSDGNVLDVVVDGKKGKVRLFGETGHGYLEDGTYLFVDTADYTNKKLGVECYPLRLSFVDRSYVCVSRKVKRHV